MVFVTFGLGLAVLIFGADLLVKGSVGFAKRLKISPLVIGLTIVAFGTSSPELFISIKSVLDGQYDIALGNVVGSNIFNVLFILGISALICPLVVSKQLIRLDIPVMIGTVVIAIVLASDGMLSWSDGLFLVIFGIGYTIWTIYEGRKDGRLIAQDEASGRSKQNLILNLVWVAAGLGGLIAGSQILVGAAVEIARSLGVSELVIALTLVAAGTSVPEVAASLMAAIRGERDMAVGNVIGSNIYNLLFILGGSALAGGAGGVPVASSMLTFDFVILAVVSLACVPIFFSHYAIDRWEGALFLIYYTVYTAYLILKSTNHDHLPYLSAALFYFVIPMSLVILAAILWSSHRSKQTVKRGG